jgi:hypothetical protein
MAGKRDGYTLMITADCLKDILDNYNNLSDQQLKNELEAILSYIKEKRGLDVI